MMHLRALHLTSAAWHNLCHARLISRSRDCAARAVLPGQMLLQTPTLSFSVA